MMICHKIIVLVAKIIIWYSSRRTLTNLWTENDEQLKKQWRKLNFAVVKVVYFSKDTLEFLSDTNDFIILVINGNVNLLFICADLVFLLWGSKFYFW